MRSKRIFHAKNKMAVGQYTSGDFQKVEDRLIEVTNKIREIRQGLSSGPLHEIRLNFNTFTHYLGEMEQLVERYGGEFKGQEKAKKHAKVHGTPEQIREAKRAARK